MGHCIVPEAEAILDKEFKVLDKGFVRLVDYMGGDERIVQSARVSYGAGTKTFREDKGLINYLLRNDHTSPFEQVVLTFHVKLPIFVARQMIRHRTARLNEISGRYSVMKDECYIPAVEDIALQSENNKQGRKADAVPTSFAQEVIDTLKEGQRRSYDEYQKLLGSNIARELARVNLPLSMYTEWYWECDLNNLMRFLRLRMDAHAQKEIRDYAVVMYDITKKVCPCAIDAFDQHMLNSVKFSGDEMVALKNIIAGKASGLAEKEHGRFMEKLGK